MRSEARVIIKQNEYMRKFRNAGAVGRQDRPAAGRTGRQARPDLQEDAGQGRLPAGPGSGDVLHGRVRGRGIRGGQAAADLLPDAAGPRRGGPDVLPGPAAELPLQ
ncbi:MAG: hypothetical protein M0C28_27315 [Candidatus Moduliflexus flocculans]|nr:hypothetical protein [Candidatus Moduliflexus flocculans]